MLASMWRKRNPHMLLVGTQIGAAPIENSMDFPQKTKKLYLPHKPTNLLLGIYLKKIKTHIPNENEN